ncbi:MAG: hypothetical protein JNM93_00570 [Bacteriovoracaceae bacterium]|nr:hypothetical protein [Bacteriovoracaceae bacterium]
MKHLRGIKLMQKFITMALVVVGFTVSYYRFSSSSLDIHEVEFLKVGLSSSEIVEKLGQPVKTEQHSWHYKLENKSMLILTIKENKLKGAVLKFTDPQNFDLVAHTEKEMVKIGEGNSPQNDNQKWVLIGIPEKGKLWKILEDKSVESISWIRPFKSETPRKNPETLLAEFQGLKTTAQK